MKKKILITGSTGFVGSNITMFLRKNYKIYVTSRKKLFKQKNISTIYFKNHDDLNKKLKKIKIDTVIHCATHYVKFHNFLDIRKIIKANIEFGVIVLENLRVMNVKKFINFSTVWQNYDGEKEVAYNLYSASKICFAKIVDYYSKNHENTKFYNLFISDTYGENDKRKKLINIIKNNIKKKIKLKIISKKLNLNLLNINDIKTAIAILIDKNIKPGNYNVTNNYSVNIFRLFKKILNTDDFKNLIQWDDMRVKTEKIYYYKKVPGWKPINSRFSDLVKFLVEKN